MDDVHHLLLLLSVVEHLGKEVREQTVRRLLQAESRDSVIAALSSGNAAELPGWSDRTGALAHQLADGTAAERAREAVSRSSRLGARIVFRGDRDYPLSLLDLEYPPLLFYARGNVDLLQHKDRSVAVVGTRSPSELGIRFARRNARELAAAGLTVVSGLALGTDAAAHAGALDADGATVAVLASGVDEFTPRANTELGRMILKRGAIISEYPPGTKVRRWSFPDRNRIIAALASDVVMLEAAPGSGSTITAEAALELGRRLWVLPGRPGDPMTAGGLDLLDFGGVRVFRGSDSVIAVMPEADRDAVAAARIGGELLELAWQVSAHLPCRMDDLPGRLGVVEKLPVLLAGLNMLKLKQVLHEDASGQLHLITELPAR